MGEALPKARAALARGNGGLRPIAPAYARLAPARANARKPHSLVAAKSKLKI